jgi:hypothetical protein
MTHDTLRALVRDDATDHEPPFTLTPDEPLARGRRKVRVRRLTAGAACVAVLGLGAALVPQLGGGGQHGTSELDAATQRALARYDASLMGALMDETVRGTVGESAPPFDKGGVRAYDSQGQTLPERYLDRASGWEGRYEWGLDHTFSVNLVYARSEAEGDPDEYCRDSLAGGYDLSCTVSRTGTGRPVITTVYPLRIAPVAGNGFEVGDRSAVRDWRRVDPRKLWFERSVEVRRGGAYVTTARETVQARSPQVADAQWNVDVATMTELATAPALVFPEPQRDENGCAFTLPRTGYSCAGSVPMESDTSGG